MSNDIFCTGTRGMKVNFHIDRRENALAGRDFHFVHI